MESILCENKLFLKGFRNSRESRVVFTARLVTRVTSVEFFLTCFINIYFKMSPRSLHILRMPQRLKEIP